jgi:hypothetical protein
MEQGDFTVQDDGVASPQAKGVQAKALSPTSA